MPQVRMLQAVAGRHFSWAAGDVVDMDAEQARVWADGVRGELTEPEAGPEQAVQPAPEKPAKGSRGRGRKPETR